MTPVEDPITTQIVISRLGEVATTMAHALYHSGYSPILRESRDGTAGLTDAEGNTLCIGGGLQYHLITYRSAVRAILSGPAAGGLAPGDVFVANDPYTVGTGHLPDMVVATPAFHDDVLVGWAVSIAHKADIGGLVPGSSGAAATEIFHDGLRLPAVRIATAAGVNTAVEEIIRANSRIPAVVIGDLRGQIGATGLGARHLGGLCDEYGRDVLVGAMAASLRLTADRLRRELAQLADGDVEARALIDHGGTGGLAELCVHLTKDGERLAIDFRGTSAQVAGPLNSTPANICSAALVAVVAALDPTIPINAGLSDVVELSLPEGSIVNPRFPAPVNQYAQLVNPTYLCVLSALGGLIPGRAVAPAGLGSVALSIGYDAGEQGPGDVQYELLQTSLGATSSHDGTAMTGTINHYAIGTPIEVIESEYPVRIRRFGLHVDSGGAGRYRGGIGNVREYELLTDCTITSRSTNRTHGAWGVQGGEAPVRTTITVVPTSGAPEAPGMLFTRRLQAGDVLRVETSGGGGLGAPRERPVDAVVADVLDGYVTPEAALQQYGVEVVDGHGVRVAAGHDR